MIPIAIFAFSGISILTLLVTKGLEKKMKKPFFILTIISRGDLNARKLYHTIVGLYSEGKYKASFFVKRQVPIHARNTLNKLLSIVKEKRELYLSNMRDARLLRQSGGISEFFKNISDVEKGNGEIHDVYVESPQYSSVVERGSQDDKKELE